jgi:capsular polysaccharide biosynthesis protein
LWLLKRGLDFQELGRSNLIGIQAAFENPHEAADIANEIVKVYHDYREKEDREFMESARYRERIEAYRKTYAARGETLTDTGKPALVEMVKPATPALQPVRPSKAVTGGLIASGVLVGLIGLLLGTRKMY